MIDIYNDLTRIFSDAFIKSVKDSLKVEEKALLGNTSTIAGKIIVLGANNFFPSFVGLVLDSFIRTSDSELKKISKQLSKLIREPFLTGIDQLKMASQISPGNEAEVSFQHQRLHAALENFDKAFNLSEPDEKLNIELLRCLTLLKMNGAQQAAKERIDAFIQLALLKVQEFEIRRTMLQKEIAEKESEADSIQDVKGAKIGGGLIGTSEMRQQLRKSELKASAKKLSEEVVTFEIQVSKLNNTIATMEITKEALVTVK